MAKSVVTYEEDATDPTAIWRIVHLRPSVEPRNIPDRAQSGKLERVVTRGIEDLRQSNMDSTPGLQSMSTNEGNFNPPSTGFSVVATGWGEDQLPHAFVVSPTHNNLNPSHGPEPARQCPQYSRKLPYMGHSGDLEIPEVKDYQPRKVPEKEILEEEVYGIDPYTHNLPKEIVPTDLDWSIDDKAEVCGLFGSVFCDFGPEITVLDVDGEDPHTGITASISNDNPALVPCNDDEADFHMKQDAFFYNLGAQMLPKSYHCFFIRLKLEYFKFSSLDSYEISACKFNHPKHKYHVILPKNIFAVSVVMNSIVGSSKEPGNIVFHILIEVQKFHAMKLWGISNIYRKAYVDVINQGAIRMRLLAEFNPWQFNAVCCSEGCIGYADVHFTKDWIGFKNALAFQNYLKSKCLGKMDWNETNQQGKYNYEGLAKEEDYKFGDPVGRFLSENGLDGLVLLVDGYDLVYDLVFVDARHKAKYASRICHSYNPNCETKATAEELAFEMMNRGIHSNAVFFNIMMGNLCKGGRFMKARNIFDLKVRVSVRHDVVSYSIMIYGYCLDGKMAEAMKLLDDMFLIGLKYNAFTYNTWLEDYCKEGRTEGTSALFKEMLGKGIHPGAITYSLMLQGLFKYGRTAAVKKLFKSLKVVYKLQLLEGIGIHPELPDSQLLPQTISSSDLPLICGTIKWLLHNKSAKVRQLAADLISRIAIVMKQCQEEQLMGHLGAV